MTINDRKIMKAIEENLPDGKFVIFPYGRWGKRVKQLLNRKYKLKETAIVDNKLAGEQDGILSMEDIGQIGVKNYVVLFAVTDDDVHSELMEQTRLFSGKVCDISAVECDSYYFSMRSEKMYIEECDSGQLGTLFDITRQTWGCLGESQPYWSVLSDKKYLNENMDEKRRAEFYESGKADCGAVVRTLIRNDVIKDESGAKSLDITEIGCGTGRVTLHLARAFRRVTAVDVSAGNMAAASAAVSDENVTFCIYKKVEDYERLPMTDVVYSIIVLQHNTPPVIEYLLNAMLQSLRTGGTAIFQVPTYREAYEFRFDEYMDSLRVGKMEMHLLTQKKIFEIAYANGCIPMEVYQDGWSGRDDFSCTFVMRKIEEK